MNTAEALKPLYKVELVREGRSRYYRVEALDGSWVEKFQGTTGISGMLDNGKSNGFAKVAASIAAEAIEKRLLGLGANPVIMEPDLINTIVAGAATEYLRVWGAKRDRGTDFHAMLEKRFRGVPFVSTDDFEEMWTALEAKLRQEGIDLTHFELPCASLKHRFATQIDGVGRCMGDWGVVDWKTSARCSDEYAFQVGGGSAQCFTETYGIEAKWAKIFRWDFAQKFWEVKTIRDTKKAFAGLLGLLTAKNYIEEGVYLED